MRASTSRPPAVTGWDGRQAVAAALAAYESCAGRGKEDLLLSWRGVRLTSQSSNGGQLPIPRWSDVVKFDKSKQL